MTVEHLKIRTVSSAEKETIGRIVDIHLATFQGFFLTFMGRGFLRQMYAAYTLHEQSDILIAESQGLVVGFLAYSQHMSGLYKYMLRHRLVQFAWFSLGAFLRKPTVFLRLIRAFLKPGEARREETYIELASIGVHPDAKSGGVGSKLIDALKKRIDFETFSYITLETDAVDNEAANRFYVKNGFTAVREYETPEGRKMLEYRFIGGQNLEKTETALHPEYCQAGQ